jgi:hypothetical protein
MRCEWAPLLFHVMVCLFVYDSNVFEYCIFFRHGCGFVPSVLLLELFSFQCDALNNGQGVRVAICSTVFAGSPTRLTCGICAQSAWATFSNDSSGEHCAFCVAAVCLLLISFLSDSFLCLGCRRDKI